MKKHRINTVKHRLLVEKDRGNACRKNQEKKTSRFFLANFFRGLSFYGAGCTSGRPVSARYRRLDPAMHTAAKAEFEKLENQRVVNQFSSYRDRHRCTSYGILTAAGDRVEISRKINPNTVPDTYPLPQMND
jgi:hypothetical protein